MSRSEIRVRDATVDDAETITKYNLAMAMETESKRLDPQQLAQGVQAALADPSRAFYLLAEIAGESAGCLMVTWEWSDWRNGCFWWIQSVYVAPARRRKGVYQALYQTLRERASADPSCCGLRLYVESENREAQRTYAALGMQPAGYQVYEEEFG